MVSSVCTVAVTMDVCNHTCTHYRCANFDILPQYDGVRLIPSRDLFFQDLLEAKGLPANTELNHQEFDCPDCIAEGPRSC